MAKLILSSLLDQFVADGLDILRAVCRPHYGATALKVKIELATDLCFTHVPSVTHRNQLQLALNAHLQGLEFLTTQGQGLGESMAMRGLMILVQYTGSWPLKLKRRKTSSRTLIRNGHSRILLKFFKNVRQNGLCFQPPKKPQLYQNAIPSQHAINGCAPASAIDRHVPLNILQNTKGVLISSHSAQPWPTMATAPDSNACTSIPLTLPYSQHPLQR